MACDDEPVGLQAPLWRAIAVFRFASLLSTAVLHYPHSTEQGVMPVTATWMAGPVLAWAVEGGLRGGVIAALVLCGCDVALRHPRAGGSYPGTSLNGPILLLLAGALVGYISRLAARAERAIQHATEIEAVSRER